MNFASLFAMPALPRNVARFFWTFTALVLLRLLFHAAGPMPGMVEIHPGLAVIPLAAICFGASGIWGAALAAPGADFILQLPFSFTRFAGYGLCGFTSLLVWRGLAPSGAASPSHRMPGTAVRALFAFLCGGFSISLWPALGVSLRGVYPFAFAATFQIFVFAVYFLLFSPIFLNQLQKMVIEVPENPDRAERHGCRLISVLVWLGGFLSLISGILVSGYLYHGWPWVHPPLGHRDGWIIWIAIFPGLLLQGVAVALGIARSRAAAQSPANSRFGSFYLPPIKKG